MVAESSKIENEKLTGEVSLKSIRYIIRELTNVGSEIDSISMQARNQYFVIGVFWTFSLLYLLLLLGLKMLHEGRESRRTSVPGRIPGLQDTLLMAVATSIDAFAVGVSLTCIHYTASRMIYPVAVISFCSWAISIAGLVAGIRVAQRISWPTEPAGGIVLIALACRIALTEWIDKWL